MSEHVDAPMRQQVSSPRHPRALAPANLILTILLSVLGALVGVQVLATLGITPSTSLIGALVAMALARIPLTMLRGFRSVHAQNLAQTSISSATFGAANSLFLPIGIPFLFGLPEMIGPMLIGVACAMLLDAWLLYKMFDTSIFPAKLPWPLGIAAAEAIKAGDKGGRQAWYLLGGVGVGVAGAIFSLPMSALGVALIGGLAAMIAFGIGLLTGGFAMPLFGLNLSAMYLPQGMMIGAGIVALVQVAWIIVKARRRSAAVAAVPSANLTETAAIAIADRRLGRAFGLGGIGYVVIAAGLALGTGLFTQMEVPALIGFVLFAAAAAFVHELIVGIAAGHSGWFPAFAVALITLLAGIMIGFPPEALVVLAGFTAATGPAFADMGYDFKAGWILRGEGADPAFELEGRRQQLIAGMIGFGVAIVVVAVAYPIFFANGLTAPINAAYVAAINAGIDGDTAINLLLWAIPGAILQLLGGAKRQIGVLLATGLLISSPLAGILVAVGVTLRVLLKRFAPASVNDAIEVSAGGIIAGDALYSFFSGAFKAIRF